MMLDWIPVSERLPDEDGEYMCTARFKRSQDSDTCFLDWGRISDDLGDSYDSYRPYIYDDYAFGMNLLDDSGIDYIYEVIAWMPVPEPYKKEVF